MTGAYKLSDDYQVEVEGVCSVTESNIGCWDADGNNNEDLAKRVRAAFEKEQGYGSGPSISIRFGKKNRLVVFKTTQNMSHSRGSNVGNVYVAYVGGDPYGGGNSTYLDLSENQNYTQPNPVYVRREVKSVAADRSATTTTARLQLSTQLQEMATIDNRPGATATFGGESQKIVSIQKGAEGMAASMPYGADSKRPRWTVTFTSTNRSAHPVYVGLQPLDASGQPISFVDEQGNPVSTQDYQKEMMEDGRKTQEWFRTHPGQSYQRPPSRIQPANSGGGMRNGETSTVILYVNPSKIAKFRLMGTVTKAIDMKDIRLDPK